ncbi:MAG: hypothetical protein M3R47_08750 [Chloroflexota bacterium]|nr:hypothetical protein [Chloroflexota bacterium]
MKTYPDLSLDEHIQGLVKHLQSYFPQLTEDLFVFYNDEDLARTVTGLRMDKKKLMNREEFEVFFEKLCTEGREWINISGDSWFGGYFLISVECSQRTGFPVTAILRGGPVYGESNRPLSHTRLVIVE